MKLRNNPWKRFYCLLAWEAVKKSLKISFKNGGLTFEKKCNEKATVWMQLFTMKCECQYGKCKNWFCNLVSKGKNWNKSVFLLFVVRLYFYNSVLVKGNFRFQKRLKKKSFVDFFASKFLINEISACSTCDETKVIITVWNIFYHIKHSCLYLW